MGGAINGSLLFATIVVGLLIAFFWSEYQSRPAKDEPEGERYRVYTRQFDMVAPAAEVLSTLETASPDFDRGWLKGNSRIVAKAVNRFDEMLAGQRAALEDDRESRIQRLREAADGTDFRDVMVALLIDQSGSMKGASITAAAAAATILTEMLQELGAKSEVLGFSTAGWHGGHAYRTWKEAGRPKRPGRLCALRHVIYKSADEPCLTEASRHIMVHPDLLRENVDGEALVWASERLSARAEPHKFLIVVSDGAPVDDATLMHNGPSYLRRHLIDILGRIDSEGRIKVAGIGINYRVSEFYPVSLSAMDLDELPELGTKILEKLLRSSAHGG